MDRETAPARPWLGAALLAVPVRGCHWPLGEIDSEAEFRFCREPAATADAKCPSYCLKHRKIAYLREGETQEDRDRDVERDVELGVLLKP